LGVNSMNYRRVPNKGFNRSTPLDFEHMSSANTDHARK
jgi:hypothetical protein